MRTVFVEDTESHRNTIRQMLLEHCPQVQLVDEADSLDSGYKLIKKENPELVLLDVELYPGTAFDLLNRLQSDGEINFEVIFLTGFANFEYPVRAIQYAALDFLMKPIDKDKLKEAIERVEKKVAERQNATQYQEQLEQLLNNLTNPPERRSNRIAFHRIGGSLKFVNIDDIVYCEADKNTTRVFLKDYTQEDKPSFTATRNLASYAKLLEIDYNFFRISDKQLVNVDRVDVYDHNKDFELSLFNGKKLYASRRGGQEFKQYWNKGKNHVELNSSSNKKIEIAPDLENNILKMILKKLLGK